MYFLHCHNKCNKIGLASTWHWIWTVRSLILYGRKPGAFPYIEFPFLLAGWYQTPQIGHYTF